MRRRELSAVRAAAGKRGAVARWGEGRVAASATIHVYPASRDELRCRAVAEGKTPADVVAELLRR